MKESEENPILNPQDSGKLKAVKTGVGGLGSLCPDERGLQTQREKLRVEAPRQE